MPTETQWRKLTHWIESERSRALEQLNVLLRMPTMAYPDRSNPALHQCAHALVQMLNDLGVADAGIRGTERHPLVLGTLGDAPEKPTLLLYGHFDVEDPGPLADWHSDPFDPTIRDGRVYARGSGDNKGQFLSHLLALDAYQKCGLELPVNLKFVLDGAEEIGSPSLSALRETAPQAMQADLVFGAAGPVHESGRPRIALGSRGVVYLEVRIRTLRRPAHSQYATVLPNAGWQAVEFLNSLRDCRGQIAIPGFYDDVIPPTDDEMALLNAIPPVESELIREFDPRPPIPERAPRDFNYQLLMEPVVNIAGIALGDLITHQTIIPGAAVIKLDIGTVPGQKSEDIIDGVRRHLAQFGVAPSDVTVVFAADPARTPPDHPLVQPIADALYRAWGVPPVIMNRFSAYSTHHDNWGKLGIHAISASYAQPDESNHAPNESLALENFFKGILSTAAVIGAVGDMRR